MEVAFHVDLMLLTVDLMVLAWLVMLLLMSAMEGDVGALSCTACALPVWIASIASLIF